MVGTRETGNETYVLGLLDGMAALEADLELYVYYSERLTGRTAPHFRRRRLIGDSSAFRLAFDLPMRSILDRIDVMHSTYSAPIWTACPQVLTVHDISFDSHPEWFSNRDVRVLSATVPLSIRRANRVITVSDLCRKQIIERYRVPEGKVVCIYNAAGPAAEPVGRDQATAELLTLGLNPGRPFLLAVGNLQPRKNLVRLISAFELVVDRGLDTDLVIVGPERYRAELVKTAGERLSSRIRFTGYLTNRQLAACYACATAFAFPSLFEGFGIPALEAMAHGTPVVSSTGGALPEVCGDAALYFDPASVASMADVLQRVLSDQELRKKLSAAGRSRERSFSWQAAAMQTLSVYQEAVDPTRVRHTRVQ